MSIFSVTQNANAKQRNVNPERQKVDIEHQNVDPEDRYRPTQNQHTYSDALSKSRRDHASHVVIVKSWLVVV